MTTANFQIYDIRSHFFQRNYLVPNWRIDRSQIVLSTRKEILWLNVLRFVRRSTILESKPELLGKVVTKSHHNGKVYYVNHYSLSV